MKAVILAVLIGVMFPASPALAAGDPAYAKAVAAFRAQRYAAAYGQFVRLADAGHVPSAQLALVMHAQGAALFGSEWSASLDQRRRWDALVGDAARRRVASPDDERSD